MPHRTARTIGKRVVPSASSASGSWELGEVTQAVRDGIWPIFVAPDPFINNVVLLLKDSLTDESLQGQTLTVNGNTQIDNSVAKYGTGSIAFDGIGDSLALSPSVPLAFGSGDFTLEFWLYTNTLSNAFQMLWDARTPGNNPAGQPVLSLLSSRAMRLDANSQTIVSSAASITTSNWHHVALVRSNGFVEFYIDGVSSGAVSDQTSFSNGTSLRIGSSGSNNNFVDGYLDELRLTKGIARYTANFTPPGPLATS